MADEQITPSVTAEGEEQIQPDVSETGEVPQEANVWYDASKVPAELQPTFKEMQSAWTKKIEAEVTPWRKFQETYGGPDELEPFLSQFTSQEGLETFWYELGEQLGFFDEETVEGDPEEPTDTDEGEFDPRQHIEGLFGEYLNKLEGQRREDAEDQELTSTLETLKVPAEAKHYVLTAALKQPEHLGVAERIKRGYEQWRKDLEAYSKTVTAKDVENDETTPNPLGGASPGGGSEMPKTFEEAKRNARQILRESSSA